MPENNIQNADATPQAGSQPQPAPQAQPQSPQSAPQAVGNTPIAQPAIPTQPPPGADQILLAPVFGPNGMMTHDGMRRQIRGGGSVIHNGNVIAREQDLPSAAELAQRDVQHAQALLDDAKVRNDRAGIARAQNMLNAAHAGSQQTTADIDQQIAMLKQQRASIAACQPAADAGRKK